MSWLTLSSQFNTFLPDFVACFMCVVVTTTPAGKDCSADEFKCDDGTCIELRFWCDRQHQCPDGSDELYCRT